MKTSSSQAIPHGIASEAKNIVPYNIVLSHEERWMYPAPNAPGIKLPSPKYTRKFYCVKRSCITKRFPYFNPGDGRCQNHCSGHRTDALGLLLGCHIKEKRNLKFLSVCLSDNNIKRSITTFYSSGVMGKRKYQCPTCAFNEIK